MQPYDDDVLLKLDKVVSFHPELANLFDSVECALLYQQLNFWRNKGTREDGFIYKTKDEIQEETYLNRYQQDKARQRLVELGVLETKLLRANGSPVLHYRVNTRRTNELLSLARLNNGKVEIDDSDDSHLVEGELMEKSKVSDSISRTYAQPRLMEKSKVSDSITETTTVNTTKTTADIKKNIKKKTKKTKSKTPTAPQEHVQLIEHVATIQDTSFKTNFASQVRAASAILKSGVSLDDAKACADLMRSEEYWKKQMFDVNTLQRQMFKYLPRVEEQKRKEEEQKNKLITWQQYYIMMDLDRLKPGLKLGLFQEEYDRLMDDKWGDEFKHTYDITILHEEDF